MTRPPRGRLHAAWLAASIVSALAVNPASADVAEGRASKGPYVTDLSDTTATIRIELRAAAAVSLELRADGGGARDGGARRARFESDASTMHVVQATGLTPATPYAYTVRTGGVVVATGRIVTAPASGPGDESSPCTFLVYGDDRTDDEAHAAIVRAMALAPADFLVNTGDMVADGGNAASWATFFDIERDLLRQRPLLSAIGNHELYDDAAGANFSRYFGFADASSALRPYGTVRFGPVRLFFLNGMHDWAGGPEREWLEGALSNADQEPGVAWRFAVVHQGPWSSGPHGPNERLVAARVPELLAAHQVDLVFSGHDHLYERGDAGLLKYVVSGGGGAPLYREIHSLPTTRTVEPAHHFIEVTTRGRTFQMVARRLDGSVLDRCGFTKGRAWDCDSPAPTTRVLANARGPAGQGTSPSRPSACQCGAPGAEGGTPFMPYAACASLLVGGAAFRRRRGQAPAGTD